MKSKKSKVKSSPAQSPKKAKPKPTVPTVEIDLTVVGLRYRLSKVEISQLSKLIEDEEGVPCTLQLEPSNEVDPKAVKVIAATRYINFSGRHIGYVRRPANESLFDLIRKGAEVKVCLLVFVDVDSGEGELSVALLRPPKQ